MLRDWAEREPLLQPWTPTKFTQEPEEARGTLAEGDVGAKASTSIATLTVVRDSCCGEGEELSCKGTQDGPLS
jgi:hypothetical protein